MAAKKEYRRSVDLAFEDAAETIKLLPTQVFSNQDFYPCTKFKVAPKWGPATRLIPSIKSMLDASGGLNVHQKSTLEHMQRWSSDNGMGLSLDTCDRAVLVLRAVVAQLLNYKSSPDRTPPKAYWTKYAVVWDKLAVDPGSSQQRNLCIANEEDDAVQVVEVAPKPADEVVISSSQESDGKAGVDMETLFSSSDPTLHKLLTAGDQPTPVHVHRRVRQKSSSSAFGLGMSAARISSLTKPISNKTVSPAAFKEMNAALKLKRNNKGGENAKGKKRKIKKKKEKGEQARKKPAAAPAAAREPPTGLCKRWLNCKHSNVWHPIRNRLLAEGKSDAEAKEAARIAAKAHVDNLKKQFEEGQIDKKWPTYR